MRTTRIRRAAIAAATAIVLPFALTACGDDGSSSSSQKESGDSSKQNKADTEANQADGPFGPACADVPTSGEGSAEGMADDPVATAASNNPLLSTLTTALEEADLVDTLNDAQDITVFAPTNDAFKKVPKEDLDALLANKEQLAEVLQYHVVGQTITPTQLENGTFESLTNQEITTSGSGEDFTVNDSAKIVCGNVETANATVYLIDSVLMPPMASGSPSPSPSE